MGDLDSGSVTAKTTALFTDISTYSCTPLYIHITVYVRKCNLASVSDDNI